MLLLQEMGLFTDTNEPNQWTIEIQNGSNEPFRMQASLLRIDCIMQSHCMRDTEYLVFIAGKDMNFFAINGAHIATSSETV
jgi:hypothetical protein